MRTSVLPLVTLALWPALAQADASLPPASPPAGVVVGGVRFTPTMIREGTRRVRIRTVAEAIDGLVHRLPERPLTTEHRDRCRAGGGGGGAGAGGPTAALVLEPGRPRQIEDRVVELEPVPDGCVRTVYVVAWLIDGRPIGAQPVAEVTWSFSRRRPANVALRVP